MANDNAKQPQPGFVKTFLLPALIIFLVPVLALIFFSIAEAQLDEMAADSMRSEIQADTSLSAEKRERALQWIAENRFSQLILDEKFAAGATSDARFRYAVFRWMIRLSIGSIVAGLLVFAAAGVCVWLSYRSQYAQYLSLSAGWHVLRAYATLQTIVTGILLVALSFWVTALWFQFYSIKLIAVIGVLALVGAGVVIMAIFKNPSVDRTVKGKPLGREENPELWRELDEICAKTGTDGPDQVIAGIDDNFYVTEMPVVVDGKEYTGRTLFVSLPLLKQIDGSEARAIMAHEMAHFSGQDTLYSRKISPLLVRYGAYLETTAENPASKPVFYLMLCFRALFEMSLGHLSRQREFRADGIAADVTSPADVARGLLRVTAYSHFRANVENELFQQERAMETVGLASRIESGFAAFAPQFASSPDLAQLQQPHPFDSHPPLASRLDAMRIPLVAENVQSLLAVAGDGAWYGKIAQGPGIEQELWEEFESGFREFHRQHLPLRYLPENDAERAIVAEAFPRIELRGKNCRITIDHEGLEHSSWTGPVAFREINELKCDEKGTLWVHYDRNGDQHEKFRVTDFPNKGAEVIEVLNRYYGRHQYAVSYQQAKQSAGQGGAA